METLGNVSQGKTLYDISKELFGDVLDDDEISECYTQDGIFVEGFPLAAQRSIWQAKEKFYKQDDTFSISIDLAKTHQFDDIECLTQSDLRILRPIFAQAYLQKAGIAATDKAVRQVIKMVPITNDNIIIQTKAKGFQKERIIIKEKPDEMFHNISKIDKVNAKCTIIRDNFKSAWSQLEYTFPRNTSRPRIDIWLPTADYLSLQVTEKNCQPRERCPSTLKRTEKVQKATNPFTKYWYLFLEKDTIDALITHFSDKFDFKENFGWKDSLIELVKQFIVIGIVPRLFYHTARYLHAIFVMGKEDLPDYIRVRALWFLLTERFPPGCEYPILPGIIVMLKLCISLLFTREAPPESIEDVEAMERSVFVMIDRIFNPMNLFDTLSSSSKPKIAKNKVPRERSLQDIIDLVESGKLDAEEEHIARLMCNRTAIQDLLEFFASETWGDSNGTGDDSARENKDESLSLPIQRMIQQDIQDMNHITPHPVSEWMKNGKEIPVVPSKPRPEPVTPLKRVNHKSRFSLGRK